MCQKLNHPSSVITITNIFVNNILALVDNNDDGTEWYLKNLCEYSFA